jgi:hypothetical protein
MNGKAKVASQQRQFEAYSYRTSSRFGSRVRVSVGSKMVSVTGPRVWPGLYRLWIAAQVVLLALVVAVLVVAVVARDWRYVGVGVAAALAHWVVSGCGAGCLWEMMNLAAFVAGTPGETTTFPPSAVSDVRIGPGWARNGLWLATLPYMLALNKISEGYCVSFEAPVCTMGGDVVYALHMRSEEEADALWRLLQGIESTSEGRG